MSDNYWLEVLGSKLMDFWQSYTAMEFESWQYPFNAQVSVHKLPTKSFHYFVMDE